MSILSEFKTFVAKGNVIDLAVGVLIGGAFGTIVQSLVKDVITPGIALVYSKPIDFSAIQFGGKWTQDAHGAWTLAGGIMIGSFINAIINFLILAFVIFFFLVKPMNALMAKISPPPPPGTPPTPEDILLLREIRDSLKKPSAAA